jgi:hypothetical protein
MLTLQEFVLELPDPNGPHGGTTLRAAIGALIAVFRHREEIPRYQGNSDHDITMGATFTFVDLSF